MNEKPKVGQTLYSLNVGNSARNCEQVLTPVIVTKVGRKYFTAGEGWRETQYHLDTWQEKSEYSAKSCLYKTPQDWEDSKEHSILAMKMRKAFDYGGSRLSLDSLRKISEIIKSEFAD